MRNAITGDTIIAGLNPKLEVAGTEYSADSPFTLIFLPATYTVIATADGYDTKTFTITLSGTVNQDVLLDPWRCKDDCSFGTTCQYLGSGSCITNNAQCANDVNAITGGNPALLIAACDGREVGSRRRYDANNYVTCCVGPLEDVSLYRTPFTVVGKSPSVAKVEKLVSDRITGEILHLHAAVYTNE